MSSHFCRAIVAAVSLSALAACTSGSVEPVTVADESWINDVHVAAIHVEQGNPDVPLEVLGNLSTHLRTVMDECVTGQRPIDLRVRVDHFEDSNVAAAYLIGDSTGMAGSVAIEDPQTGGVQGEYYIDSMQAGFGLIGAIALSDAENDIPMLFAEQLCEEVFSGKIFEQEAAENPGGAASTYQPQEDSTEDSEVGDAGTALGHVYQAPEEPTEALENTERAASQPEETSTAGGVGVGLNQAGESWPGGSGSGEQCLGVQDRC
jgi:hypothetical protein